MSATSGMPGSEWGALALALMMDRDGTIDVKTLMVSYSHVVMTAAMTSIHIPSFVPFWFILDL